MKTRLARAVVVIVTTVLAASTGSALATVTTPSVGVKWTEGNPSPFAGTRFDGQYVKFQNRIYFLGFRQADDSTSGEVWYYNLTSGKYVDTGTAMPVPISNYGIAMLDDGTGLGLYTFGGRSADVQIVDTVQVYYPKTNTAKVITSDPWPGTTPSGCISLPAMGVAMVDNVAYVMGGISFSSIGCIDDNSNQVWRFDPMAPAGEKWVQLPSLTTARGYVTPAVLQGTGLRHRDAIYAIGGDVNDAGNLVPQSIVEKYKPGWTAWNDRSVADLPEPCDESQAFAYDTGPLANTITLAGCGQWPGALADVLQYERPTNSWTIIGALNEARRNQAGANYGTADNPVLFVLGGYASDGASVLQSSEIGQVGTATDGPVGPHPPRSAGTGRVSTS